MTTLLMATNRTSPRAPSKYRGYKNVANIFLEKIGLQYSAKQMKNEFDNLKKDWVAWKKLENASHGLTGIGYDHETGLITAPDHWWAKMQARDGTLSAGTPLQPGHDTVGENVVDSSLFEDALLQSAVEGSANPKWRKRATPGTVASSMDNLVELVSKQSRELKITQYVVTSKGDNTVGDYLARLMSTPGLETCGKLFSFACGIMDSPDNGDIIMALSQNCIVNWLTEKCAYTPANVGRDREGGTRLFGSGGAVDLD
ncbi:unnamed protein product [Camellia sinensis]